jgi:hypothetical protein
MGIREEIERTLVACGHPSAGVSNTTEHIMSIVRARMQRVRSTALVHEIKLPIDHEVVLHVVPSQELGRCLNEMFNV